MSALMRNYHPALELSPYALLTASISATPR